MGSACLVASERNGALPPSRIGIGMNVKNEKLWTVSEVVEFFQVEETLVVDLEEEEVIQPIQRKGQTSKFFSADELEKVRLAKILVEEMGVNVAGVDVILRMRQNLIEMRAQFDSILEDVAKRLRESTKDGS
jgi:MerR family transcriptional regulator/heat shock protein HspR